MKSYVQVAAELNLTALLPFLVAAAAIVVAFALIVTRRKKGNRERD